MVDWSWIISQITFWSPSTGVKMEAIKIEVRKRIQAHLASTEMQRVPSLVEEKYLGAAIWVRRPTESALGRMLGKPGGLAGRQHRMLPSVLLDSLLPDPDPDGVELE